MAEYRWYDVLNEITKVERKYNIRNPNWDNGFPGVFKDYGFVPVDTKGDWWTRIPDAPELPIIYAPVANTSYTVPTGIGGSPLPGLPGQTTTGIADSVNVIIDGTYRELPSGETVAEVTTAGVATSVSSAVATGAVGAAIGFGVGVGVFELAPEFCTKVSNKVFGTDLDPTEVGQMASDTNALVVIKDGIVYMAEDMINAIRNAFFDNGAADVNADFGVAATGNIDVNTFGDMSQFWGYVDEYLQTTECWNQTAQDWYDLIRSYTGYADVKSGGNDETGRYVDIFINHTPQSFTNYGELPTTYGFTLDPRYTSTARSVRTFSGYDSNNNTYVRIKRDIGLDGKLRIVGLSYGTRVRNTPIVIGYTKLSDYDFYFGTVNASDTASIPALSPTGNQGTKEQPIATLFPDWVSKGIETIAGDGVTKVKWLPVSLPATNPLVDGNPFTTDKAQEGAMPGNYTETANQLGEQVGEQTKNAPSYPTPPITPVPPITPTPTPPSIAGGGGSSTGLANLYNPTLAQVKEFSRWLWGSDGLNLDQLKKLLQDPMQAIIGLHVMYATPTTGADRTIQVGYINSGVSSKIVTEQYTEIDCGTVTINEYFGDARDYSPFTQIYCYLPFIGIVELNADDVVNSTLGIKYKIDVLTGCCLAQLTVKKYGLDAVLYTYTGNCAVQMPITSGNYLSTISSLLGTLASGAAAVATGGALAPVAIGAAASSLGGGARASVAMSGSLGSNAGAMGIRKPYLIIKRVESADANGFNEFYGYPTNKRVQLSQLSGYVRVKEINLSGTNATEDEQNEIVTLLKEGVIL